jgi:hypothetical protein
MDGVATLVNAPQALPKQPLPAADQFTPALLESPVTVAVKLSACPITIPPNGGETATLIPLDAVVTVIAADAALLPFATEVAVSVTAGFDGIAEGAVYTIGAPEMLVAGDTVPHVGEHRAPDCMRVHVTPRLCESFCKVAMNDWSELRASTLAVVGATVTSIADMAFNVIVADADLAPSVIEVAVSVTVELVGTVRGAVYTTAAPDRLELGETVPHVGEHGPPDWARTQATPLLLVSFCKAAVNDWVPLGADTFAVMGATLTATAGGAATEEEEVLEEPPQPQSNIAAATTAAAMRTPGRSAPNTD